MSEQLLIQNPEHHEALLEAPERQERLPEHSKEALAESLRTQSQELSKASVEARAQAEKAKPIELGSNHAEQVASAVPQQINRELKQITLRRELQMIRRKLPAPQRALSKVIHQPIVRATSEAASKSVSRPSGLLGGGLVAFLGTLIYTYMARHIGFAYNNGVFLALFAGGFVLGLGLELLVHSATASHRRTE